MERRPLAALEHIDRRSATGAAAGSDRITTAAGPTSGSRCAPAGASVAAAGLAPARAAITPHPDTSGTEDRSFHRSFDRSSTSSGSQAGKNLC
jgi:hypothetical protein